MIELGPCPRCGKRQGELQEGPSGRFKFVVACLACGWSADPARLKSVAAKLWNETKRAAPVKARAKGGKQ